MSTEYSTDLLAKIADASKQVPPPPFGQVGAAFVNAMGGTLKTAVVDDILGSIGEKVQVSSETLKHHKGVIVSRDDLKKIFSYVSMALSLPATIKEAEEYLGYKSDADFFKEESHKFLTPDNQVAFDKPIIAHAKLWADLEQSIKNQGNELNRYAKDFVMQAESILEVLNDLSKYLKVKGMLDAEGKDIVECGAEILENWKTDTERHKNNSEQLYNRLVSFSQTLENQISASVNQRSSKVSSLGINKEFEDLAGKITNLKKEIKDLQAEYDKNVGLAFTGSAAMVFPPAGVLAWLITGGIFGAAAEKVRKEKNAKEEKLAPLQKQYNAINTVVGGVNTLEAALIDFKSAVDSAIIGVQHLNTTWDSIVEDIKGAQVRINNAEKASYVKNLLSEISIAKQDWSDCGDITRELVEEFDRARREFV